MTRRAATLSGKRMILRPPVPADYEEFAALLRNSRPLHRGWLTFPFKSRKGFREYCRPSPNGDRFRFLMCRKTDGVILGSIGLFQIVRQVLQSGVVGYLVGAPFARQGFATEALGLVLRFAFRDLKLHRIEASIRPGNAASIALVRRSGFHQEGLSRRYLKIRGRWRDHERWAILVEEWRRRRGR